MAQGESGRAKPCIVFRIGRIEAAVWENVTKDDAGNEVRRNSVTLRKSWKANRDDRDWQEAKIQLFMDELHDVALILDMAERQFRVDVKA
jgi:hypothetical protein